MPATDKFLQSFTGFPDTPAAPTPGAIPNAYETGTKYSVLAEQLRCATNSSRLIWQFWRDIAAGVIANTFPRDRNQTIVVDFVWLGAGASNATIKLFFRQRYAPLSTSAGEIFLLLNPFAGGNGGLTWTYTTLGTTGQSGAGGDGVGGQAGVRAGNHEFAAGKLVTNSTYRLTASVTGDGAGNEVVTIDSIKPVVAGVAGAAIDWRASTGGTGTGTAYTWTDVVPSNSFTANITGPLNPADPSPDVCGIAMDTNARVVRVQALSEGGTLALVTALPTVTEQVIDGVGSITVTHNGSTGGSGAKTNSIWLLTNDGSYPPGNGTKLVEGTGAIQATITGLNAGEVVHLVCRTVDAVGNTDNTTTFSHLVSLYDTHRWISVGGVPQLRALNRIGIKSDSTGGSPDGGTTAPSITATAARLAELTGVWNNPGWTLGITGYNTALYGGSSAALLDPVNYAGFLAWYDTNLMTDVTERNGHNDAEGTPAVTAANKVQWAQNLIADRPGTNVYLLSPWPKVPAYTDAHAISKSHLAFCRAVYAAMLPYHDPDNGIHVCPPYAAEWFAKNPEARPANDASHGDGEPTPGAIDPYEIAGRLDADALIPAWVYAHSHGPNKIVLAPYGASSGGGSGSGNGEPRVTTTTTMTLTTSWQPASTSDCKLQVRQGSRVLTHMGTAAPADDTDNFQVLTDNGTQEKPESYAVGAGATLYFRKISNDEVVKVAVMK